MQEIKAELLSTPGNNAVVRLEGRKFPGVLVQGDTLFGWLGELTEALAYAGAGDSANAMTAVQNLAETLREAADTYVSACAAQGIELPFARPR